MQYNNDIFGVATDALTKSEYNETSFSYIPIPPPGDFDLIDNDGNFLIDNDGYQLIEVNS